VDTNLVNDTCDLTCESKSLKFIEGVGECSIRNAYDSRESRCKDAIFRDRSHDTDFAGGGRVETYSGGDGKVLWTHRASEESSVVAYQCLKSLGNAGWFLGHGDIYNCTILVLISDYITAHTGNYRGNYINLLTLFLSNSGNCGGGCEEVLDESLHVFGDSAFLAALESGGFGYFDGIGATPADL